MKQCWIVKWIKEIIFNFQMSMLTINLILSLNVCTCWFSGITVQPTTQGSSNNPGTSTLSSPGTSNNCTPSSKGKRKAAPEWFSSFVEEQREAMKEFATIQKEALHATQERNDILRDLVNVIKEGASKKT